MSALLDHKINGIGISTIYIGEN